MSDPEMSPSILDGDGLVRDRDSPPPEQKDEIEDDLDLPDEETKHRERRYNTERPTRRARHSRETTACPIKERIKKSERRAFQKTRVLTGPTDVSKDVTIITEIQTKILQKEINTIRTQAVENPDHAESSQESEQESSDVSDYPDFVGDRRGRAEGEQ
ncbi:hypothetical protein OS493_000716 [Desmophyllum pertusum]|uniref:Uncharacterized protein n=1 Tax=Desmophyllum pertusum TaxID=174260 RepID=A0A9X0A7K3_9CNID|nr:hypothetical protein OS493_000716 [Desmophyllum pertusum]